MHAPQLIAALTTVAFLAAGAYLIWSRKRLRFPKGKHAKVVVDGIVVHIIYEQAELATEENNNTTVKAIRMCNRAWLLHGGHMIRAVPELCVYFQHPSNVYRELHGYQSYVRSVVGKQAMPLLVCSSAYLPTAASPGVVSHEVGHLLAAQLVGHPDSAHTLPAVWAPVNRGERPCFELDVLRFYTHG